MEKRAKQIAELLKVLANENRLMIFCALMRRPMTVGEIASYVPNITHSALSQHLSILKAHGILDFHKSGQSVTYSIADNRVERIIDVLKEHYCNEVDSHSDGLPLRLESAERIAELLPADTLRRIGLTDGKVLCDIGAGTGVFALPASEVPGVFVYAVEISEKMRQLLSERIAGRPVEIATDIRNLPDSSCDIALLSAVLHEVQDIKIMESHIRRVLKPSGLMAVIEFHKRQTPMGPPVGERISPEEVALAFEDSFSIKRSFILGENFYCTIFEKGL